MCRIASSSLPPARPSEWTGLAGLERLIQTPLAAQNGLKIIAVANQKGGVGKTTTAVNLGACLSAEGVATLVIDLDPQANATSALGHESVSGCSLYEPLVEGTPVEDKIQKTRFEHLHLLPADLDLAGVEIQIAQQENHLYRLRRTLEEFRKSGRFEYALLDCPPSLGILMTNALVAADELLIPLQCEYFALEGLEKIYGIMTQLQAEANPALRLNGVLMTMFDMRTNLSTQVVDNVRESLGSYVYETVIPRTVALSEAPSYGKPILEYEPSSRGAQAYRETALEFLRRQRGESVPQMGAQAEAETS